MMAGKRLLTDTQHPVGADDVFAPTVFLKFFRLCVGDDAHIVPLGTIEFALELRKIGFICRVDVGIDPYAFG